MTHQPAILPVSKPPGFHWFSYYDKFQLDATDRYLLGMRADFDDRPPTEDDVMGNGRQIYLIDIEDFLENPTQERNIDHDSATMTVVRREVNAGFDELEILPQRTEKTWRSVAATKKEEENRRCTRMKKDSRKKAQETKKSVGEALRLLRLFLSRHSKATLRGKASCRKSVLENCKMSPAEQTFYWSR